jgi:hypothetical protein
MGVDVYLFSLPAGRDVTSVMYTPYDCRPRGEFHHWRSPSYEFEGVMAAYLGDDDICQVTQEVLDDMRERLLSGSEAAAQQAQNNPWQLNSHKRAFVKAQRRLDKGLVVGMTWTY